MDDTTGTTSGHRRNRGAAIGLIAVGAVAGGLLATAIGASAATNDSTNGRAASGASPGAPAGPMMGSPGGMQPVRSDESSLGADRTAMLKAAALKAAPGGTVYRVESDAGDGSFEAHMTKADGTMVTVKFDKDLSVTKVETGMGAGDPAMAGQPLPNGPTPNG